MDKKMEKELELYKKMYHCLFNAITDAERYATPKGIIEFLKLKQMESENIYIEAEED